MAMIDVGTDTLVSLHSNGKKSTQPLAWWISTRNWQFPPLLEVEPGVPFVWEESLTQVYRLKYSSAVLNAQWATLAGSVRLTSARGAPIRVDSVTEGTLLRTDHGDVRIEARTAEAKLRKKGATVEVVRCNVTNPGYLVLWKEEDSG